MVYKKKIAIIGSGPSSLATLIPMLEQENLDITVISSGENLFNDEITEEIKKIKILDKQDRYKFWLNKVKQKSSHGIIPKKNFFGDEKLYSKNNKDIKHNNIEFDISHSIGGLTNVWGANVSDLSLNDKKYYDDISSKLSTYLYKITDTYKIAGENDQIDNGLESISYQKKKLNYCKQAEEIKKKFDSNSKFFEKKKIRIGYAKLAIKTDDEKNACENCGMCMFGCHQNSIFNSAFFYNQIEKIKFISNCEIKEIEEIEDKILLRSENKQELEKIKFDNLFVAAGTINSSKLALKFLKKFKKNQLEIKDSQKYFFLYLTGKKSTENEETSTIGLSQIFLQTEIDNNTFHLQLYHSKVIFGIILQKYKKLGNYIKKFFSFFLDRIMIGVVYYPSEISNSMIINLNKEENNKVIFPKKNKNFSNLYILKLLAKLVSCVFKLKSFPLPIYVRSKIGVSQHFGSSLPMKEKPTYGECDLNGKLFGSQNIFITDSSSLPRIPSTPTTFLTMAHALRISENFIKTLK